LPVKGKKFEAKEMRTFADGDVKVRFFKKMENPQALVQETWRSGAVPNTLYNRICVDVAAQLLDMKYLREIREELSAAYTTEANAEFDDDGLSVYLKINATGGLTPDKAETAIPYLMSGMQETAKSPNPTDLQSVKQNLLKNADIASKDNSYWLNVLDTYGRYGVDIETDYKKIVESITPENISDFLQDVILKSGNHIQIVMMPEGKE
jgi:zinc protease